MAGSGERIDTFAERWSASHGDAPILRAPKEERFALPYVAGVLYISHGMGMPSASIAVQELMKLMYFPKRGNAEEMDKAFWARVGTSGGVGLPGGTIVVSTEGVMADLKPFRLLDRHGGYHWFDGTFPRAVGEEIMRVNADTGIPMAFGKTVAGNEYFIEQLRLDGAIAFETPESKRAWLQWLDENGVRNIEIEGAMITAYLNYWGFSRFAMVCTTLLNRLEGDQVLATKEKLADFTEPAGTDLFTDLETIT